MGGATIIMEEVLGWDWVWGYWAVMAWVTMAGCPTRIMDTHLLMALHHTDMRLAMAIPHMGMDIRLWLRYLLPRPFIFSSSHR